MLLRSCEMERLRHIGPIYQKRGQLLFECEPLSGLCNSTKYSGDLKKRLSQTFISLATTGIQRLINAYDFRL